MKFNKKVLDNGLTILHEKRDVPVTTVMLAAKHGAGHESVEEKGMSHFMEHLCFKGTEKRKRDDIVFEVERVGGSFNAFTGDDMTAYFAKLPSGQITVAMDVIFDIFFNASFPKEEVTKEAGVIQEEMKMIEDMPRRHIFDKIKESLYEPPFGLDIIGSRETVTSMTQEKLFEKHRKIYSPSNAILCVVGNNSFEEVVSLAEKFVVERECEAEPMKQVIPRLKSGKISKEHLNQTNIAIGFHFPKAGESLCYAAEVFSSILGGGMSSRLFREVREKRGLVYTVRSDVDSQKDYGYLVISAGTDPSKEKEVIDTCLAEYKGMDQVTEEELEDAKTRLIGSRHIESEDSQSVAIELINEELISGDASKHYEYEKGIRSVTLEQIKELAKIKEYTTFTIGP